MSPADDTRAIRRRRSRTALMLYLTSVLSTELLFCCFIFGTHLGPMPFNALQTAVGAMLSLALGVGLAALYVRRKLELRAKWVANLIERPRSSRRIAFFDDYVTIDSEVVLKPSILTAQNTEDGLRVAYRDPISDTEIVRIFDGPQPVLARARQLFDRDEE